ncbi:zinc finger and BTB domain-containing protein 5 [Grus japonensis]|uniref:Zinc finger and BTB domain-containing protein 5 n=1 Tax=Grus japonensis TaxID=30415 RepID=A0ABC9WD73_GRUJA
MEDLSGADIHPTVRGGPYATAGGYALKEAAPRGKFMLEQVPGRRGVHAGAGFLAGPAHGGSKLEQSVPERLQPMGRIHAGEVLEELQPMGRTHNGAVHEGLSPVGGTPHWSRERVQGGRSD